MVILPDIYWSQLDLATARIFEMFVKNLRCSDIALKEFRGGLFETQVNDL